VVVVVVVGFLLVVLTEPSVSSCHDQVNSFFRDEDSFSDGDVSVVNAPIRKPFTRLLRGKPVVILFVVVAVVDVVVVVVVVLVVEVVVVVVVVLAEVVLGV